LAITLYCSFCGKSQHEVRKLIAGPNAYLGGIEFAVVDVVELLHQRVDARLIEP
jgi:ATP-dependent protease Clp ATPase subunit